jgi:[ribosomal protein S5]-alanine N-acetyltransferase
LKTITLHPFHAALADALFDALQDPALYDYIDDAPPIDREGYRARCKRLEHTYSPDGTERWLNWAVKADNEIVGYVQATVYAATNTGTRDAEFAYAIHSSQWGQGVAHEACTQMLSLLQSELGVTRLWLTILNTNTRSLRLAQRLGLREASSAQYPYTNFEEGDIVMMGDLGNNANYANKT